MSNEQPQPVKVVERTNIKRQNQEQFNYLKSLCEGYLASALPESNIVLESEFGKFIPLFNTDAREKLTEDDIKRIATEYRGRFSLQHPIKVISAPVVEPGEGTALYAGDRGYHKVILTLPPMFARLRTLNDLGPKVPALIDALMTSSSRKDPFNMSGIDYTSSIIQAMQLSNPEEAKKEKIENFKKIEAGVLQAREQEKKQGDEPSHEEVIPSEPDNNSQDDAITTGDSMFEWD